MFALIFTVVFLAACILLDEFRDLRNLRDRTDLYLLLFQYATGIGAFLSFMILLWSL